MQSLSDLDKSRPVHLVGIGGAGMSALAGFLLADGCTVTGSDMTPSPVLNHLSRQGARIHSHHNPANILSETQVVVKSAAVEDNNPEVAAAISRKIPVIKYARMLGVIMNSRHGIAVSGTHGKTTTTAMVSYVFKKTGLEPSFVIGGSVPDLGGSWGVGSGDYFIAEACEFDRSFLHLNPRFLLINNVEEDHLDCYRDLEDIRGAFSALAGNVPDDGIIFHTAGDPTLEKVTENFPGRIVTYGLSPEAEVGVRDITFTPLGTEGILTLKNSDAGKIQLKVPGRFNLSNALGAAAIAREAGIEFSAIVAALSEFSGVKRRFEVLGDFGGVTVVDDYAHHPSEIKAVLSAARNRYPDRRLVVVFQPHQASRTRFLLKDFASSFAECNLVVVPDIYFARDTELEKSLVGSGKLVSEIRGAGGNAVYVPSFAEILAFLSDELNDGDVLVTMGAGDVDSVARGFADIAAKGET